MTTEYTKGPWFADEEGRIWRRPLSELYERGGTIAGDKPIAVVYKGWYGKDEKGYPVEANAHLIAAAPELLEACMAMIEWDDREKDHAVDFNSRMDLCQAAFDKARAAIAKATGEQQ